jgi:hypothetical protein
MKRGICFTLNKPTEPAVGTNNNNDSPSQTMLAVAMAKASQKLLVAMLALHTEMSVFL